MCAASISVPTAARAYDDVKGGELDPDLVKAARDDEIGYVLRRTVYKPSRRRTRKEVTGAEPIETGWSDINKGDPTNPNYRSRLVGKEYRRRKIGSRQQLFAGTPPTEAMRMLVSLGVGAETMRRNTRQGRPIEYIVLDVRRAHFYARALRRVFIKMPPEDPRYNAEDPTAELEYSLYGTQDAAAW